MSIFRKKEEGMKNNNKKSENQESSYTNLKGFINSYSSNRKQTNFKNAKNNNVNSRGVNKLDNILGSDIKNKLRQSSTKNFPILKKNTIGPEISQDFLKKIQGGTSERKDSKKNIKNFQILSQETKERTNNNNILNTNGTINVKGHEEHNQNSQNLNAGNTAQNKILPIKYRKNSIK